MRTAWGMGSRMAHETADYSRVVVQPSREKIASRPKSSQHYSQAGCESSRLCGFWAVPVRDTHACRPPRAPFPRSRVRGAGGPTVLNRDAVSGLDAGITGSAARWARLRPNRPEVSAARRETPAAVKSLFDRLSGFDGGDQLQGLLATLIQSMRRGEAGAHRWYAAS